MCSVSATCPVDSRRRCQTGCVIAREFSVADSKRWSSRLTIAIAFVCASAAAQERDENAADTDSAERAVEEITVTGSRIRRSEFNTTAPIQVITTERSQLAGLLDATDILQNSPVASGQQVDDSFAAFVRDGGAGANSISLRGLGAQRTLVLVNGKRWGPSGVRGEVNAVDLTALPTSLIHRYEILKDGASSVYGADAVAGVVNAITRQRFDGGAVNVQIYTPEAGGSAYSLDGIWGRAGDDWSFNVSAIFSEREETFADEYGYSRCERRPRSDGSNTRPDGTPYCYGLIYGLQLGPFGFTRYEPSLSDPNDLNNPFRDDEIQNLGIPYWTRLPLNDDPNQGPYYRDTLDPAYSNIEPESTVWSVNSFGDYELSIADRNATAYYEFYFNQRETETASGLRQFLPRVPAGNPTNIMGQVFGDSVQPVLPSYQIQDPRQHVRIDRYNTFAGLKGDISSDWTYDAYIGYSYSDGEYAQDNWLQDETDASLNAVIDGNGNLVCAAASLVNFPNCVAGDLFTEDALLRGVLPQDYLDFISKRTLGRTEYTSYQFAAFATGPVAELPAGALQLAVGYEFRNEKIDDVPDIEFRKDNLWGRTSSGFTGGEDSVNEIFVETEIPVWSDRFLVDDLTLNASWRLTNYDSYGSDDTYRIALDWQIHPLVRVRASQGTSFRAPDLFEQFLANQTGFSNFLNDPCIDYGTNFDPGTSFYDNCAAQGLAPDFGTQGGPSVRSVVGGNQDLEAETSESWTAGLIVTPQTGNVSLALNWFDIELTNTVAEPTVSFVLGNCYNSPGLSSPFCQRVAPRDTAGFLTDVDASLLNVGLLRSRGMDIDFLYQHEFPAFDLTIDLSATRLDNQQREILGNLDEFRGNWGFPEWVAQGDIRVDYQAWTLFTAIDWIGSTAEIPVANRLCSTGQQTYTNVSVRYRGQADWEVIGTIRNAFDNSPPIVSDGCGSESADRAFNTIPGAGYDLIGRAYALQLSKGFGL